jgi:hypothetical protein
MTMTKTNAQAKVAATTAKAVKAPTKANKPVATPANKDVILQSSGSKGGEEHFVKALGGETVTFPTAQWTGEIRKLASIGGSFKALTAALAKLPKVTDKPKAQMARGVQAGTAPHSAKSIADQAGKAKATNKADGATQKAPKAKADKPAKVTSAHDRSYAVVNTDHGARPDTKRARQLLIVFAHKGTAAARAAGAETCDFAFAAQKGFIKFN